jgi:CelD/BcsL family acetyltransferase involved in cellulose biosynthesis
MIDPVIPMSRRPSRGATAVEFRAYAGAEGLARVEADWAEVLDGIEHPHFVHHHAWYDAWARHLARDPERLRIFVAYADGAPVAVFPLAAREQRVAGLTLRTLEFPTARLFLSCDLVFDRNPATAGLVASFVEHLRERAPEPWDALVLWNLLEGSAGWSSLRAVPPPRTVLEEADRCHFLPVMALDERMRMLRKNFRGVLRRARAAVAQEPGAEFVRARTPGEIAAALPEFLAVEASGWKGANGSAIGCDARLSAFYSTVALGRAASGGAEINLLRTGGRCIAAQYCLKAGRCLYVLKIGYDEDRARLAPGHVLLAHVLERCHAERDVDVVNLVSEGAWQERWRCESSARCSAFAFNGSARGLAAYAAMRAKARLRPLVRSARSALRRARSDERAGPDEE